MHLTLPHIIRREKEVVDIAPGPSLDAPDAWRAFAGAFVFAALDQRPIWMIAHSSRSIAWAFPERYQPTLTFSSDGCHFSCVHTSIYDEETILTAVDTDWKNNGLIFVPDTGYKNSDLATVAREAFDEQTLFRKPCHFEYFRSYWDFTGFLWLGPGERIGMLDELLLLTAKRSFHRR